MKSFARLDLESQMILRFVLSVFFEETYRWPRGGEKPRSNMIIHFHKVHEIGGVKCYKDGCDARFHSEEHRRLHVSYCTEIWKENPKLRHKRFSKGTREDC